MTKEIDCKHCHGTGITEISDFPTISKYTCEYCKGSGKRTVTKEDIEKDILSMEEDITSYQEEILELQEMIKESKEFKETFDK